MFFLTLSTLLFFMPAPGAAASDPCAAVHSKKRLLTASCKDYGYCSQVDRVKILCHLKESLKQQYSLYHLKGELLSQKDRPFDSEAHLDSCIRQEIETKEDPTPFHFLDRVRACVAGFRDTHLWTENPGQLPSVFTVFDTEEIRGKFYVSSRSIPLLKYLRDVHGVANVDTWITLGTEVVSIDGVPVAAARDALKKYISASSDRFAAIQATEALTTRNFVYPEKGTLDVTFKTKDETHTLRLPWWYAKTLRKEFVRMARERGYLNTELVNYVYNREKQTWEAGFDRQWDGRKRRFRALPVAEYESLDAYAFASGANQGGAAYTLGTVIVNGGKSFGYIQILSFMGTEVNLNKGTSQSFIEPLRDFIVKCKRKELPLLVDLRVNGGGVTTHPAAVLSLLLKKGQSFPSPVFSFRATPFSARVVRDLTMNPEAGSRVLDAGELEVFHNFTPLILDEVEESYRAGKKHTPFFVSKRIHADAKVDGYPYPIVVLTSPECVSACDITAALLKNSGVATVVGTPTNGTGAGFFEREIEATWKDSWGLFKVKIPNKLFLIPQNISKELRTVPFEMWKEKEVGRENQPTEPKVLYEESLDDLLGKTSGLLDAALPHLFPKKDIWKALLGR